MSEEKKESLFSNLPKSDKIFGTVFCSAMIGAAVYGAATGNVALIVIGVAFTVQVGFNLFSVAIVEKYKKMCREMIDVNNRAVLIIQIARDLYPDFDARIRSELELREERNNRRPPSGPKDSDDVPQKVHLHTAEVRA